MTQLAQAAYSCPRMSEVLVLPGEAMASMTVYDLDSDASGDYVEQIHIPVYEYYSTPLRASDDSSVNGTIYVNRKAKTFTGTAISAADDLDDLPSKPTALTTHRAMALPSDENACSTASPHGLQCAAWSGVASM